MLQFLFNSLNLYMVYKQPSNVDTKSVTMLNIKPFSVNTRNLLQIHNASFFSLQNCKYLTIGQSRLYFQMNEQSTIYSEYDSNN